MSDEEIQFFDAEPEPSQEYVATVTLTTHHFADLGPVLDAIENVVRVAPRVTGKVDTKQYSHTFYGWDFSQ